MAFIRKKNKKFDYKPRYYKGDGNPYQIKHKFDQFRNSTKNNTGLKKKLMGAIDELKSNGHGVEFDNESYVLDEGKTNTNKIIFFIIALLILIFLFIIDFDLSIFNKR